MILFPQAKINLGLHVLSKRHDSFHELDTCMVTIPLCDILEIIPSEKFSFNQSGLMVDSEVESNLCVKAFRLIQKEFHIPNVYIHLRKQIPMGAGLGGGSSDAAQVINGLNEIFSLNISTNQREELAAQLGSDCPFFIEGSPKIAKGRGEILSPIQLDLSGYFIKLIYPNIHISTSEAYADVAFYKGDDTIGEILKNPIETWKNRLQNSFETNLFAKNQRLKVYRDRMYEEGAIYAAMSGSGSTIFGIFKERKTFSNYERSEKHYFFSI